ncbi:MAG: hypothetical protein IJZ53_11355 [Tyzzerella sp.]|nr:hypothetical protein [Tyzzerella sp.]
MKSRKAIILGVVLIILTAIAAVIHLSTREEVPENAVQISANDKTYTIDIKKLNYEQVEGIRVNGKGEEIPVEGAGIALKDILAQEKITEYSKVTVVADDSYSAELTAEEIKEDEKVYLLNEEESLRLIVFGDENSKRSVSNVVQIIVE